MQAGALSMLGCFSWKICRQASYSTPQQQKDSMTKSTPPDLGLLDPFKAIFGKVPSDRETAVQTNALADVATDLGSKTWYDSYPTAQPDTPGTAYKEEVYTNGRQQISQASLPHGSSTAVVVSYAKSTSTWTVLSDSAAISSGKKSNFCLWCHW